jgi:hypothetical protein
MRLELIEVTLEAQKQTVLALEQQLHDIDLEQSRRLAEDRSYQTQIAEIDQGIADHKGDQEERGRLEAVRSALVETSFKDARPVLASLAQRQSELSRQLPVEKDKLQALRRRVQKQ